MKKVFSLLLVTTFLFASCNKKTMVENYWDAQKTILRESYEVMKDNPKIKIGKYESFFKTGKPEFIKHFKNNLQCDTMFVFDEAGGFVKEQTLYANGKLNGTRTVFFETGKPMIIETYKDGSYEGTYNSFFKNGNPEQQGQYVNGQMGGEWKFYYENGKLKEKVMFAKGEENGAFESFYASGNKKATGFYLDTKEDSTWLLFYESGELMEISNYKHGMEEGITKDFAKDSTLQKEIEYHNGLPVVFKDYVNKKFSHHPEYKNK